MFQLGKKSLMNWYRSSSDFFFLVVNKILNFNENKDLCNLKPTANRGLEIINAMLN